VLVGGDVVGWLGEVTTRVDPLDETRRPKAVLMWSVGNSEARCPRFRR
jgi:hypothetical protein